MKLKSFFRKYPENFYTYNIELSLSDVALLYFVFGTFDVETVLDLLLESESFTRLSDDEKKAIEGDIQQDLSVLIEEIRSAFAPQLPETSIFIDLPVTTQENFDDEDFDNNVFFLNN